LYRILYSNRQEVEASGTWTLICDIKEKWREAGQQSNLDGVHGVAPAVNKFGTCKAAQNVFLRKSNLACFMHD